MGNLSIIYTLLLLLCFSGNETENSQYAAPATHYIVELTPRQRAESATITGRTNIVAFTRIHPSGHLYRLEATADISKQLDRWKSEGILTRWQYDRPVQPRATPNDPLWPDQWSLQKIAVEEAWDRTTGGVTAHGDTIVIAILDTGYDIEHEDLHSNLWKNHGEIPGDGIDNDMNGYVDDYLGINVRLDNDAHPRTRHGTNVAGVIGARGNNATGITGINWHVKLLLISGIQNESDIIEGYMYCKAMRDLYDASNGTKGAFIVATNLSAGIDNAQPADHQMWCDQYDLMGQSGILSICATTNGNIDVDSNGDMPTTCPSPYLIAVTITDMADTKPLFAGYGAMHIDLGAPGTPLLSTALSHGYEDFDGTSAAAPHVAGVVGLLYSAACHDLLVLAQTDRAMLSLQMKNLLLTYTDLVSSLDGITVSGGRLNAARAVGGLIELCGIDNDRIEIVRIAPNPAREYIVLTYNVPDIAPLEINLYDSAGRLVLREIPDIAIPGTQTLNIPTVHFPPGVYYLALQRGKEVSATSLVIH